MIQDQFLSLFQFEIVLRQNNHHIYLILSPLITVPQDLKKNMYNLCQTVNIHSELLVFVKVLYLKSYQMKKYNPLTF